VTMEVGVLIVLRIWIALVFVGSEMLYANVYQRWL